MFKKESALRPPAGETLKTFWKNVFASGITLYLCLKIFGVNVVIGQLPIEAAPRLVAFLLFTSMTLLSALRFTLLWHWLIREGRTPEAVNWGAAFYQGGIAALTSLPLSGFFVGLLLNNPLGALFALVALLLVPTLFLALSLFGVILGAINAKRAQHWLEASKAEP
jgi:hypothetical protein